MLVNADFHIHSCFSMASSKDMLIKNIAPKSKLKGLGLLGTGDSVAAKSLADKGITEEFVRERIESVIGVGEAIFAGSELALTPRSKRILEMAAMEAICIAGVRYILSKRLIFFEASLLWGSDIFVLLLPLFIGFASFH